MILARPSFGIRRFSRVHLSERVGARRRRRDSPSIALKAEKRECGEKWEFKMTHCHFYAKSLGWSGRKDAQPRRPD
jgi:hypothetical protein